MGRRGLWKKGLLPAGAFALLCLLWPEFAEKAARWISVPAAELLARISGKFPVPVFGVAAFLALAGLIFGKGRRGGIAFCLAAAYVLLWLPPTNAPAAAYPRAEQARTEALCRTLAEELTRTGRQVVSLSEGLTQAQAAMNAPARPKAARFPAWLRGLKAAGMYVPFTGEALVDPTRSAAGLPFTAAHELAHMLGKGNEGAANIAAYVACVDYGEATGYSARLWALKYAMGRLTDADWVYALLPREMAEDLAQIPWAGGGGDYDALVDYLCASVS